MNIIDLRTSSPLTADDIANLDETAQINGVPTLSDFTGQILFATDTNTGELYRVIGGVVTNVATIINSKLTKLSSVTANAIARWNGTTKELEDSGVIVDSSNNITANSFSAISTGTAVSELRAGINLDARFKMRETATGAYGTDLFYKGATNQFAIEGINNNSSKGLHFTVERDSGDIGIGLNGAVPLAKFHMKQRADSNGFQLNAFTLPSEYLKIYLDVSGFTNINASKGFRTKVNNINVSYTSQYGNRFYDDKYMMFGNGDDFRIKYNATTDKLQMGAGNVDNLSIDTAGNVNASNNVSAVSFETTAVSSYDKFKLWGTSSQYTVGMKSACTYGALSSFANTFTMGTSGGMGWLWRTNAMGLAEGAMSLSNTGKLTILDSITVGGDVDWTTPTLLNGWLAYNGGYSAPRYRVVNNILYIQGLIKSGTVGNTTTGDLFQLPTSISDRISGRHILPTQSNTGASRIDVFADGIVRAVTGGNTYYTITLSLALD